MLPDLECVCCNADDCEYSANGYPFCPGCGEHHRQPVGNPCPVDQMDLRRLLADVYDFTLTAVGHDDAVQADLLARLGPLVDPSLYDVEPEHATPHPSWSERFVAQTRGYIDHENRGAVTRQRFLTGSPLSIDVDHQTKQVRFGTINPDGGRSHAVLTFAEVESVSVNLLDQMRHGARENRLFAAHAERYPPTETQP